MAAPTTTRPGGAADPTRWTRFAHAAPAVAGSAPPSALLLTPSASTALARPHLANPRIQPTEELTTHSALTRAAGEARVVPGGRIRPSRSWVPNSRMRSPDEPARPSA